MLTYGNDPVWAQAKEVGAAGGFKNKWIEIIDYYNMNDGKHVNIFCAIENKKYRILYLLDDNSVLLLNREGELEVRDYDTVEESRKIFFFEPQPEQVKKPLPDETTLFGHPEIEYYE